MSTLWQIGAVLLLLKGNSIFFLRAEKDIPIGNSKEISIPAVRALPVFMGNDAANLSEQTILAYGKETHGPHLWVMAGSFQFFLLPQIPTNNISDKDSAAIKNINITLEYQSDLRLYLKRTMEMDIWRKYIGKENFSPKWYKFQNQKRTDPELSKNDKQTEIKLEESNRFLYEIPSIKGKFILKKIPAEDLIKFQRWQALANTEQRPIQIDQNSLSPGQNKIIKKIFLNLFQKRITSHWSGSGLILWLKSGAFQNRAMYIFLGDYSYRLLDGAIMALDKNPFSDDLSFLRLKNDKLLLSSIPASQNQGSPINLKFSITLTELEKSLKSDSRGKVTPDTNKAKPLDLFKISSFLKWLNPNLLFLEIGSRKWLLASDGMVKWDSFGQEIISEIKKELNLPKDKGMLYFTSIDNLGLTPESENLIFFKIFIDKYEKGRTKPSIGSRTKELKIILEPGRHLLRAERWELNNDSYRKVRKILQPGPIFIDISINDVLWINLDYAIGEKPKLIIKKQME